MIFISPLFFSSFSLYSLPNRYYVCCARSFDVVGRCCLSDELTIYSGSSTNQLGDNLTMVSLAINALTNDSVFSAVIKFLFFSSVQCVFCLSLVVQHKFCIMSHMIFSSVSNNERAFQNEQSLRTNG